MMALRILFMGTAELSCASLQGLAGEAKFQIAAVVTQPDRPKGRDLKPQPSPVKTLALRLGLPVLQPERARDEKFIAELLALQPDLIIVVAYGQILPPAILDLPRHGCLNVHTSLLPKYRGAAPIQWAILEGESQTGVTIMKMDAGMDTGAILTQRCTPITPEDNGATLHDRLALLGAELLLATIPGYVAGEIVPRPQPAEGVTYAPKIKKTDGHIDWTLPARTIFNRWRAFTPWPGAYASWTTGAKAHTLKIWAAQVMEQSGPAGEVLPSTKDGVVVGCGEGSLRITELQREGGRRMTAGEFLAGHPLRPGERLG